MEKYHILVVDDENLIGSVVQNILERQELDTVYVSDAHKALEHLSKYKPALVITDYHMPSMNGGKLMKTAKERNHQAPFLIMTGNPDDPTLQREVVEAGYSLSDILHKPFTADSLYAKVSEKLGDYKTHKAIINAELLGLATGTDGSK